MNDTLIYLLLFAMLGVLACFIAIALQRKSKGFKIVILRDFRNPNRKHQHYWAMFDSRKDEFIKLYSNIFRPLRSKIIPPADMAGYSYDRTIYAYQGVSGHPDDDNIVFIHLPLVGRTGANEYAINLSEAIEKSLDFYEVIRGLRIGSAKEEDNETYPLRIGDAVEYLNLSFTITHIDHKGVVLSNKVMVQVKNKDGTDGEHEKITETVLRNPDDLSKLLLVNEPEGATAINFGNFFSTDWVMQEMGVIPVEDVNTMLATVKSYIASYNSKLHDKAMSKMSFWARNPYLIYNIIMIFVIVIASSIVWYSVTQDAASVGNTATSAIQHIMGLVQKNTSTATLPAPK